MLQSVVIAWMLGAPAHLTPPPNDRCWTQPLQLTMTDIVVFGRVHQQALGHCGAEPRLNNNARPAPYVIGRTQLASFELFGKPLTLNIDVVMAPSVPGVPDTIYATPKLQLPEEWQKKVDAVTAPVLVVGGAAILGTVVYQLLSK